MTLNPATESLDPADPEPLGTALEQMLRDVEQELGLHLTLHDHLGVLSTAEGAPLLPGRNLHAHPCCRHDRHRPAVGRRCVQHCVQRAHARCRAEQAAFETHCWKGVREVVVPIFRQGDLALTLFAGGFRAPEDLCPIRSRAMRERFLQLTVTVPGRAERLARILETLGTGLLRQVERQTLHRDQEQHPGPAPSDRPRAAAPNAFAAPTEPQDAPRESQIRRFLHLHAHRADLRLSDLAAELCLSPSRCGHLVRERLGESFQDRVTRERLKRARALLVSTSWPLPHVGAAVGLPNPQHFSRLFKKHVGVTPGEYRRTNRR